MKKALSVLLIFTLLLTSLWSVMGVSVASTVEEAYFEAPENWKSLRNGDVVGESATGDNVIEQRAASTGETYNGGDIAIRFWHNMHNRAAVISLPVEKGKTYKLSFQYKATFSTGTDYDITHSGVYEKGALINNAIEGTALATKPVQTWADNNYHAYELTFTVGDNTELYFVARFWTAAKVWFDDFKLEDITPGDTSSQPDDTASQPENPDQPNPPAESDRYFETPENWKALKNSDVVGTTATGDNVIEQRTASTGETYNGSDIAIRFWHNMHNRAAAIALPVEKGKTYKLSFQYKATFSTGSDYDITHSGVYEKGAIINNAIEGTALATKTIQTWADNNYHAYELTFTVESNTDLYFVARFWTAAKVWFDDFKLEDITPDNPPISPEDPENPDQPNQPTDEDNQFENVDKWLALKNGDIVGTTATADNAVDKVTSETFENSAYAIRFWNNMHNRAAAVALPVEKDKTYTLSFRYKATYSTGSDYDITHSGVYEKGATINNAIEGTALATKPIQTQTDNDYHAYELTFKVGENTEVYFVARFWTAGKVWFDNFTLTEVSEDELGIPWKMHGFGTTVFGEAATPITYAAAAKTDKMNYNGEGNDGDEDSYEIVGAFSQYPSAKISFEQNKYYNLTFWYYGTELDDQGGIFSNIKLVCEGGENSSSTPDNLVYTDRSVTYYTNKNGAIISLSGNVKENVKKDEWNKLTLSFYSGENSFAWLAFRPTVRSNIYVDNFILAEATEELPYNDEKPFNGWGGPAEKALINFDDFFVAVDPATRVEVTSAPAKDGKQNNKALHFIPGVYDEAFRMNNSSINKDPVFTVPVEPGSLYEFSYWIFVSKDEEYINYFGFYYDFDSTWLLRANGQPERGEWVKKSITFTTKSDMTHISLTINPGEVVRDIYIDDILVRRIMPGTIGTADDASYCDSFYDALCDQNLTESVEKAKTGVYKVKVDPNAQYTFAATVLGKNGSKSNIMLSFDAKNPLPISEKGAPSANITSNGNSKRYAYSFVTDNSGYLYLLVNNDDGALKVEDVNLFRAYSLSTNIAIGSENKIQEFLSVNNQQGLKKLPLLGETPPSLDGDAEYYDENPSTGSNTVLPFTLIFITALFSCGLLFKKKREVA